MDNIFEHVIEHGSDCEVPFQPRTNEGPTMAIPGSKEKMAVMIHRVCRGEDLWNDDDGPGLSVA